MTLYIIYAVGAVIVAALAYKIGQLKERLKNAEIKSEQNKNSAQIAARPHSLPADIRNRMHNGEM